MLIKEYRVVLPVTVDEYQVGQLWSVAEASKNETGGGEGIEVLNNEPYENVPLFNGRYSVGQYTHKIYHLASKVPAFVRLVAPRGSLALHEKAWNAYPYCKTVFSNPDYMKENFEIRVETIHLPDRGTTENAHQLPSNLLSKREVVHLDISNREHIPNSDYKEESDPTLFKSTKTGRGPLLDNWQGSVEPVMCAYKLVICEFKWWGLQNRIEKFIQSCYPRLFVKFHREVFCWLDQWHGLTMTDIRMIEDRTREELNHARKNEPVKGMKGDG